MKESVLDKVFSKNKNIVFREEADFGLLFNIETGRTHKINPTAATIWKSIDSKKPVAGIVSEIMEEYNENNGVTEDVLEFLSHLEKMEYIAEVFK